MIYCLHYDSHVHDVGYALNKNKKKNRNYLVYSHSLRMNCKFQMMSFLFFLPDLRLSGWMNTVLISFFILVFFSFFSHWYYFKHKMSIWPKSRRFRACIVKVLNYHLDNAKNRLFIMFATTTLTPPSSCASECTQMEWDIRYQRERSVNEKNNCAEPKTRIWLWGETTVNRGKKEEKKTICESEIGAINHIASAINTY